MSRALTSLDIVELMAETDAMFEANLETGLFTWVSKPLLDMFRYSGTGVLDDEEIEILVAPEFRDMHRAYRAEYAKNPVPRMMGQRRPLDGYRHDESRFPIEVILRPRRVKKIWYVVGTILDMTGRLIAQSGVLPLTGHPGKSGQYPPVKPTTTPDEVPASEELPAEELPQENAK